MCIRDKRFHAPALHEDTDRNRQIQHHNKKVNVCHRKKQKWQWQHVFLSIHFLSTYAR